jgi:hypothetical protein
VEKLLPELDRDNYAAREAARQELIKLGPQAALVIYGMDRGKLSAEQRCQLDSMLTLHAFLSRNEAQRLQSDVDFLLDCLYSSDGVVRQIAARRLERAVKHSLPLDPAMDYDARVKQIDALRGQLGRGATTQASNKG